MPVIIDAEVYINYFLLCAYNTENGKSKEIEVYNDKGANAARKSLAGLMRKAQTVSFNGLGYDLLIISKFISGGTNAQLKELSDTIIKGNLPAWRIAKDRKIKIPEFWDHIDIMEVAPSRASLKIYAGRLRFKKMQDLPIAPEDRITSWQTEDMRSYCHNDVAVTLELFKALDKPLKLREQMGAEYEMDLRSKSDAQIAETVIKSEYQKITGEAPKRQDKPRDKFNYIDPKIISFESEGLKALYKRILKTEFTLGANGAVKLPEWLSKERISVAGKEYQMGIGGLHSCEKRQYVDVKDSDHLLCDMDVASYYPSIILQQELAPDNMGAEFLKIYQSLVERRIKAKRTGDKATADTLKIAINGSFGKLGSKWSALYAPELLIQTTITGQLALLMLIERMESASVSVVSANTDGVVLHYPKSLDDACEAAAFDWMLDTSYELERTEYTRLASRDVNNYVAVKPDGSYKGKGVFAATGLMKNPDFSIVPQAVSQFLAGGLPVAEFIRTSWDLGAFLSVRRVNGGAVWKGKYLGKAVRFYYSNDFENSAEINYKTNNNKVPKSDGSKPLMDFPEALPDDIDYDRYINAANELLEAVGYA